MSCTCRNSMRNGMLLPRGLPSASASRTAVAASWRISPSSSSRGVATSVRAVRIPNVIPRASIKAVKGTRGVESCAWSSVAVTARQISSSHARRSSQPKYERVNLTPGDYHKHADHTLDLLQDKLEGIIENAQDDVTNDEDWDIESASGVLNVKFGSRGTYVINKQPPNQQMWLSSPTSGPKRFDFGKDTSNSALPTWFSEKEGETHELWTLLRTEIGAIVGEEEASILVPEEL